jgi:hypothetical protein
MVIGNQEEQIRAAAGLAAKNKGRGGGGYGFAPQSVNKTQITSSSVD